MVIALCYTQEDKTYIEDTETKGQNIKMFIVYIFFEKLS